MTWQTILKVKTQKLDSEKEQFEKVSEVKCPKCEGKGCSHCDGKGYHKQKKSRGRGFTA
tara:strand:- start:4531 stop:4707 length:177 start_codon:yes stop_codon:yes gene_type:complete